MAPFTTPTAVLTGVKEKIDSLTVHADRLYLGSSIGNLYVYSTSDDEEPLELVEVKKALAKRSIEQLGFIKDVNSLVVLSEMTVTLFPLPSFSPPTPLPKAKAAFSFAIHTYVQNVEVPSQSVTPSLTGEPVISKRNQPIPTLFTFLLCGCRRKAVLYSWKDGEPQDVKEAPLPHSARTIVFLDNDTACFAYSPTEFAIFTISTMTAVDVVTPLPTTTSGAAMNALTGLTGYMTLGLGAKAKPGVVQTRDSEVLISKDGEGYFIGTEAKTTRPQTIEWPGPPEEIGMSLLFDLSLPLLCLPAGTVPLQSSVNDAPTNQSSTSVVAQTPSFNTTSLLQIRSILSYQISQTLHFPFNASPPTSPTPDATAAPRPNAQIRLLSPSAGGKSPVYLLTTPLEKNAAASEGSTIWKFSMKPWTEQIDQLVLMGKFGDALALLETLDENQISDKDQRRTRIRALNAVSQFKAAKFDVAIDTFIELDFNPAKVVALYPETVAGRIAVPPEGWIPLYGGPAAPLPPEPEIALAKVETSESSQPEQAEATTSEADDAQEEDHTIGKDFPKEISKRKSLHERRATDFFDTLAAGTGSVGGRLRRTGLAGLQALLPSGLGKDDDTASITSKKKSTLHDDLTRSVETLVRYLSDRRPKLSAALKTVGITPESQSHLASPLSEASLEELFALPNAPLSALTPEQLLRFAQIVDTALYKSYLIIRPALLGSLCRVANWCEVSEVEDDLRARKKFAEMRDLYNGKKMHSKALDLLKELSEAEPDMDEKLGPSIQYLQKLGPEYIDQIFRYARWIFDSDSDIAFQIFTSEDVELPRKAVADYLEKINPKLCAKYLEYLISERQEESSAFHDRLGELYLNMTIAAKRKGDEEDHNVTYGKLLAYLLTDERIAVDRLYGLTSSTDLHEARAILLGRLGRHDQALETYVYKLEDQIKAEEYCKRVYQSGTETSGVFLTLLRIYLRPTAKTSLDLLAAALDLISRQSPRLDSVETLQLLPPLVTTQDLRSFLIDALRAPVFDTRVVSQISKARNDQLSRRLMGLQARRVKVTDSRICPQCHKRIGNSVIAVHVPRGEVTHYNCREPFSKRLNELRR